MQHTLKSHRPGEEPSLKWPEKFLLLPLFIPFAFTHCIPAAKGYFYLGARRPWTAASVPDSWRKCQRLPDCEHRVPPTALTVLIKSWAHQLQDRHANWFKWSVGENFCWIMLLCPEKRLHWDKMREISLGKVLSLTDILMQNNVAKAWKLNPVTAF